ncbi:hypothetical protein E4U56_005138 [Claviceps arundinis]|uniref:Glutathione S-transferase n=1 Tax=Claviceps arundinis TaxID=1623583 RepID=A0A9P7MZ08_9HYPO|nr:hypothetical protein E4U56_005138 [Claviceps arundinis]
MAIETDITLYAHPFNGPNEASITIAMSILDLQFKVITVDASKEEHRQVWYRKLNPNSLDYEGSLPVITDTFPNGEILTLFETGTILEYLADRYDLESRIKPRDCLKSEMKVISWLYWSLGQFAPLLEQIIKFDHYVATEQTGRDQQRDQQIADYLSNQSRRYFRILDDLILKSHGCMIGDRPTIADIACVTWASLHNNKQPGNFLEEFPNVQRWLENMIIWTGGRKGTTTGQLDAVSAKVLDLRITGST